MRFSKEENPPASLSGRFGPFAVALFAVAAMLLNQSVVHRRENTADSHLFAYYGWLIADGARPYLDTWDNKPPGIWWANALAFRMLGDSRSVETAVGGAALLAGLMAAAGILATLWCGTFLAVALPLATALLTHLAFECGADRTETLVNAAELLGVFAYFRWLASQRRAWLVTAGLLLGVAPWCKQSGLGAIVACGLHLLFAVRSGRIASFATLVVGLCLPTFVFAAILARQGALGEAWYAVVQFNRLYFDIDDAGWHGLRITADSIGPHLSPVSWYFLLGAVAVTASIVRVGWAATRGRNYRETPLDAGIGSPGPGHSDSTRTNTRFRGATALFAVWLLVDLLLVAIGVGRLAYHLMVILPPLALLAVQGLAVVVGIARRDEGATNFTARLVRSPRSTTAATIGLAIAASAFADSIREGARFAAGSPLRDGATFSGSAWIQAAAQVPVGFAEQAALIQRLASPADTIYVWGWSPGSYRYAYRRCPSRFATIEKVGQLRGRARFILDEVAATLRRNPPAVFLISPNDLDGLLPAPRDEFAEWFDSEYERVELINGMWIMKRDRVSPDH
ncbi:MAG: hypothetical protein IT450_12830 [Phycisphaerales bacterium]|nr:hypothetical protein [Phycisphaerales bacterium]